MSQPPGGICPYLIFRFCFCFRSVWMGPESDYQHVSEKINSRLQVPFARKFYSVPIETWYMLIHPWQVVGRWVLFVWLSTQIYSTCQEHRKKMNRSWHVCLALNPQDPPPTTTAMIPTYIITSQYDGFSFVPPNHHHHLHPHLSVFLRETNNESTQLRVSSILTPQACVFSKNVSNWVFFCS